MNPSTWSLSTSVLLFLLSGVVIAVCGVMLTTRAERVAKMTGLGQAVVGAVFLGMVTSLAGSVTSINAALKEVPEIAVGNAVGGIAAQTTFLVLADFLYRGANLEHAAASEQNLFQGVVLVLLLALALLASAGPGYTLWEIDIFSPVLLLAYAGGLYLVSASRDNAMWIPKQTPLTTTESTRDNEQEKNKTRLWISFVALAAIVAAPAGLPVRRASASAVSPAFRKLSWALFLPRLLPPSPNWLLR